MTTEILQADGVVWDPQGIPTSIRLFKVGSNPDCRGLDVEYDPGDAEQIVKANTRADGTVCFDIAHGTLPSPGDVTTPEQHKSVGWGKLRADGTGVWLDDIKWTPDTVQQLMLREWRFISPGFNVSGDADSNKPVKLSTIISVALTNIPATVDAQPIVRSIKASSTKLSEATPKKATKRILTNMAKREDEDDMKDKDTVVRDDEDDKDLDIDNLDTDGMDADECRSMIAKLCDMVNKMRSQVQKREEDDEEEDDEEKRSIVANLFRSQKINFTTKQRMMKASLKEVKAEALKLDAKPAKVAKRRIDDVEHQNSMLETQPQLGATVEEIVAYASQFPSFASSAERLGLTKRSETVQRYGVRLSTQEPIKNTMTKGAS